MINQNLIPFRLFTVILFAVFCFASAVPAQDKNDETTGETESVVLSVPQVRMASPTDDDDSRVTGATVRGRLVYEDTNRPMRYALVALVPPAENYGTLYSSKFVKTDETGNFVIRNVKPGTYIAYVKSEGILNQDSYKFSFRRANQDNKPEQLFEKIEIGGLGEFQIVVAARRGGSISGKIVYADGEAAVGVMVEALRKEGEIFSNISSDFSSSGYRIGMAETDDRGAYRISGLPDGQYIIRVIEPISHGQNSAQYIYNLRGNQNSILRTYYPEGETSKNAKEMEILPGQEQAGIDIMLPERRLFTLSGRIAKKSDGTPLENFSVTFYSLAERDTRVADSLSGNATVSNKNGEWTLKGLPKGKYRITIMQGYNYSDGDQKQKKEAFTNMVREIEITDENLAGVNFDVPSEASVTGTIVAEGGKDVPEGVRIVLFNEENRELNYSDYNFEGKKPASKKETAFRIGKMNEGKYRLASLNGDIFYVKSATLGGRDIINSAFEIKEGESLSGLRIVISTTMGTVKGKVGGYDGKTEVAVVIVESGVVFGSLQAKTFSARVQPTGDFEMKAAPGEYTIIVLTQKNRPQTREEAKTLFEEMIRNGQKVTVKDAETTNVSVSLPN
jgi:5-hydroxyisourate hydrolase-like protein (transthyretin family)